MDGWVDSWWLDGDLGRLMDGWTACDLMDGWVGGLMDGLKNDAWVDGSMDKQRVRPHRNTDLGLFSSPIYFHCPEP